MRALTAVSGAALLLLGWSRPAQADLLVASFSSGQILRYDDATGGFLGAFATGIPGGGPVGLGIGPDGDLYVGSNPFVFRFDGQTGAFLGTFAGGGGLLGPHDLAFGPDGNLYVASFGGLAPNSKVIRYDGVTGAYIDDFVPVGSGGLSGVEGMLFGPDGNLYLTSRVTNHVLRYEGSTGAFLGVFATGGQNGPVDLAFGPDGNLYVLTTDFTGLQVLRFEGATGTLVDVFVGAFPGGTDGSSLTFGPDGNLYVTTGFIGNSVLRFDGSTGAFLGEFAPGGSGGLSYATGLLFRSPVVLHVTIDIKPGSSQNRVNLDSNGVIPVAILTTETFAATAVDPGSLRFGPDGAGEAHRRGHAEDVDGDGDIDLLLHFRTREAGISPVDTAASLSGTTLDGASFEGSDSINPGKYR